MKNLDFIAYTAGLQLNHENLSSPKLVKLEIFEDFENRKIILRPVSARNLNRITSVKDVILSTQEYNIFAGSLDVYDEINSFDLPLLRKCGFYLSSEKE